MWVGRTFTHCCRLFVSPMKINEASFCLFPESSSLISLWLLIDTARSQMPTSPGILCKASDIPKQKQGTRNLHVYNQNQHFTMTPISARLSEVSMANSKAFLLVSRLSRISLVPAVRGTPFTGCTSMAGLWSTSRQGRSVLFC